MGRTEFPDLKGLRREPWLDRPFFIESEMALFSECMPKSTRKVLDTADIVRDAIFRQVRVSQVQAVAIPRKLHSKNRLALCAL